MLSTLAAFDFGQFGGMAIGFGLVVIVPIVAMMLGHQRRMAELFHRGSQSESQDAKIESLEREVRELKDRINHLILQSDERRLQERISPPTLPEEIRR